MPNRARRSSGPRSVSHSRERRWTHTRHAHLDDPGREEWEGFPSGTRAAAAGGLTTLVDMPLNSFPSTVSEKTFELKIQAVEKRIHVDVENAFNRSALDCLLKAGVLGLKSFMCPSGINDFPMTNAGHIKEGLSVLAKYKRPLLVHAEIEQELEGFLELEDSAVDPRSYSIYHSPSVPELKCFDDGNFLKAWGGISSLQFVLLVTWTYGRKYGFTLEQLASWWSEKPAELAGLDLKVTLLSRQWPTGPALV